MTRPKAVQQWLHEGSFEAAQDVAQMGGAQGEAMGYMYMMDTLDTRFPALLQAVKDLTGGCGRVDLHWRPLSPSFSRLYVAFDGSASIDIYVPLDDLTQDAAREVVQALRRALPSGDPFPNRPNKVTAMVGCNGHCVPVRLFERLSSDGNTAFALALKRDDAFTDPMPVDAGLRRLISRFRGGDR